MIVRQIMPIPSVYSWFPTSNAFQFEPPCYEPTLPTGLSQGRCSGQWTPNITIYDQLRVPDVAPGECECPLPSLADLRPSEPLLPNRRPWPALRLRGLSAGVEQLRGHCDHGQVTSAHPEARVILSVWAWPRCGGECTHLFALCPSLLSLW